MPSSTETTLGGPCPTPGSRRDVGALDAIGGHDDRAAGAGADLPLQLLEPARRSPRRPLGADRGAAARPLRRRDRRRHRARCAVPVGRSIEATPGFAETVTLATARHRRRRAPRLGARARGVAGEHERHGEDRGRAERARTRSPRALARPDALHEQRGTRGEPAAPRVGQRGGEQDQDRARGAHDRERAEQRDLGAELGRLRRDQERTRSARSRRRRRAGRCARRGPSSGR